MSAFQEVDRADLPQVVTSPIPRVYVYDHCPYCVRVRYALGMKNIKHQLVWLLNDDKDTPTALVGKKVVPIFQMGDEIMKESMDIVRRVDGDPQFGPVHMFGPETGRFQGWFSANADPLRRLLRTRHVLAPLPEFSFKDGRNAFIANHPLPEPSDYAENLANSAELVQQVQRAMPELESLIFSPEHASADGLSYDDVDLFARLRSFTIIRDLHLPPKVSAYVEHMARTADIPLYTAYAQ